MSALALVSIPFPPTGSHLAPYSQLSPSISLHSFLLEMTSSDSYGFRFFFFCQLLMPSEKIVF